MEYMISKLAPTIYIPTGMNVISIEPGRPMSDWPEGIGDETPSISDFTSTER